LKTDGGTRADLARSVLSVPPLARNADFAPNANRAMIRHLETGDDIREASSPIRALHEAVTLAGAADMGPMLPQSSNLPASEHPRLQAAAAALLAHNRGLA